MRYPRTTTFLSCLGFTAALALAIFFRPQNVAFQETKAFPEFGEGEYGDVIGIELGRTYSRVGIMRNNTFEIITDEQGRSIVPSYVAYTNKGHSLVGFEAMDQAASNPKNTIYDVRHLIGRKFSDPQFQDDIRDLPYEVVDNNGSPSVKVKVKGAYKFFTLEDISGKVLEKLKDMAQKHLNGRVTHAVIAVPPYFNDSQRQATKDAAVIAGLTVLRLVKEPTAAGIAHGLEIQVGDTSNVIYNLGLKESDVALVEVEGGVYEILAHARDTSLGGEDFENALLSHSIAQFEIQNLVNIKNDPKALKELKFEVEKAEENLTTESAAMIQMPAHHFSMFITQKEFQEISKKLSDRALDLVKQIVKEGKVEKGAVDGLIFTGDQAQIAKIQPFIEAYLDGKRTISTKGIHSDEAIVQGVAIQGAVLSGDGDYCSLPFPEVLQLSLGIETSGGVFTKFIPRNTMIPTYKMREFTTVADNQDKIVIKVLEGERGLASKNKVLGTFELTGLSPKSTIEILFEMDITSLLTVTLKERETGKDAKLVITDNRERYTWEEIDQVIMEAEKYWEEDQFLLKESRSAATDGHCFGIRAMTE